MAFKRYARTILIDRDRWKEFFWRRRIALVDVGSLMDPPRCRDWASIIGHKGHAGLLALESLADNLGMTTDALIYAVGTDEERERDVIPERPSDVA